MEGGREVGMEGNMEGGRKTHKQVAFTCMFYAKTL